MTSLHSAEIPCYQSQIFRSIPSPLFFCLGFSIMSWLFFFFSTIFQGLFCLILLDSSMKGLKSPHYGLILPLPLKIFLSFSVNGGKLSWVINGHSELGEPLLIGPIGLLHSGAVERLSLSFFSCCPPILAMGRKPTHSFSSPLFFSLLFSSFWSMNYQALVLLSCF